MCGRENNARHEELFAVPLMGPGGVFAYSPFTAAFNASGQPAVSLPLHWTDNSLPVGVHLAASFGADALLMGLAAQLETAMPWREKQLLLIRKPGPQGKGFHSPLGA